MRKLQKTGKDGESYMLTLPKAFVKKLGWKEHQKVVVELKGSHLVITDWVE
ncbi:AbrB/MazE/SpoVT family DNA-binding domain-containing protein [Candidatus Saccharibacteria bacterium]|nr:AbrB/MazE/SpoVT family DNA-binding domain-containing protein [Candidatus Saccharibacteria bacterium]